MQEGGRLCFGNEPLLRVEALPVSSSAINRNNFNKHCKFPYH